jgi:hypothetical protein
MGHTVEARVHPNVVEGRYRDQVVQTMPRLRKEDEHRIDYRHVIGEDISEVALATWRPGGTIHELLG